VVKVEKDLFFVLNQYGNVVKVKAQQIRNKRDASIAVTKDREGRQISSSDTVMVIDGANQRQASILHIYRSFVFLQSREVLENGGIFVTNSSNVSAIGQKV
jgi:transcription elongation factor SPT5